MGIMNLVIYNAPGLLIADMINSIQRGVVLVGVLVVALAMVAFLAYLIIKKKMKGKKPGENDDSTNYKKRSIYELIDIEQIKNNMVILDKGTTFIMAIRVQGSEFYLNTVDEQDKVISNYTSLFNLVKEPMQFHIQTRTNDIEATIVRYQNNIEKYEEAETIYENELMGIERQLIEYKDEPETIVILKKEQEKLQRKQKSGRLLLLSMKEQLVRMQHLANNKDAPKRFQYYIFRYELNPADLAYGYTQEEILKRAWNNLSSKANGFIAQLKAANAPAQIVTGDELKEMNIKHFRPITGDRFKMRSLVHTNYGDEVVTSNSQAEIRSELVMGTLLGGER